MTPKPISRREALALAAGSLAAAACSDGGEGAPPPDPDAIAAPTAWMKDPRPFTRHGTNLETHLEDVRGFLVPNDLFFVRNHAPTPDVEAESYRLTVGGPGVARPITLTLADLEGLPQHSLVAYLECAGNWRGFFQRVMGQAAEGSQWGTGAVGCAEWTGPRLSSVLELAGVTDDAVDVNLIGLDDGAWERPMPLAKATDPDTILALVMNGSPLPPDHGYPVRGVVPGWVGSSSVKWLGEIHVATEKVWVASNTTSYVLVGDEWPADEHAPADGAPITTGRVKSALALPWPAEVDAGPRTLRGFAYSPRGPVARVDWSLDGGETWSPARLVGPQLPWAWSPFEIDWDAEPGEHTVMTRATDAAGERQPMETTFNAKGYLLNLVLPHPVVVVG